MRLCLLRTVKKKSKLNDSVVSPDRGVVHVLSGVLPYGRVPGVVVATGEGGLDMVSHHPSQLTSPLWK